MNNKQFQYQFKHIIKTNAFLKTDGKPIDSKM